MTLLRGPQPGAPGRAGRRVSGPVGLAWPIVLVLVALAGCADTGDGTASDGGLRGHATVGPTCPVQRDPPDPACADRPYNGTLEVRMAVTEARLVGTVRTDASGGYAIALPPGEYMLQSPGATMPRCGGGPATVAAHAYTTLDVTCDSGIR